MDRRKLIMGLVGTGLGASCQPSEGQRPIFQIAIGRPVELKGSQNISEMNNLTEQGAAPFITSPHSLIYNDDRLHIEFPNCGSKPSMPTSFLILDGVLESCSASILEDYTTLGEAIEESERIYSIAAEQNFAVAINDYARYGIIDRVFSPSDHLPINADNREALYILLMDEMLGVSQVNMFIVEKNGLEFTLILTNMRRKYGSASAAIMDKSFLEGEKAYNVEINFQRTFELQ